jgi:hypothetical protein
MDKAFIDDKIADLTSIIDDKHYLQVRIGLVPSTLHPNFSSSPLEEIEEIDRFCA